MELLITWGKTIYFFFAFIAIILARVAVLPRSKLRWLASFNFLASTPGPLRFPSFAASFTTIKFPDASLDSCKALAILAVGAVFLAAVAAAFFAARLSGTSFALLAIEPSFAVLLDGFFTVFDEAVAIIFLGPVVPGFGFGAIFLSP